MELSQLEMSLGRAFEWTDELSNATGAMLGAGVYAWVAGVYRTKEGETERRGEGASGSGVDEKMRK